MEARAARSPHTLFWIAGIAVTVFSGLGIAAIMGWLPTTIGSPGGTSAISKHEPAPVNRAAPRAQSGPVSPPARAPDSAGNARHAAVRCVECGVIESVREVDTRGEGSGLGAVGGAVVGGVLGNQVGGGRGQDIATVAGALGGAVAGNEIEKRVKSTKSYEITVRFEDGSSRVIRDVQAPTWRTGDRVKVIDGVIRLNA